MMEWHPYSVFFSALWDTPDRPRRTPARHLNLVRILVGTGRTLLVLTLLLLFTSALTLAF